MTSMIAKCGRWIAGPHQPLVTDIGLLVTRVGLGLMISLGHGRGKLEAFLKEGAGEFPDPLGVGHTLSMMLAIGAEFFCGLAIVVGLATRLALTQLIATMAVAALIIHANDDFGTKERALLYLVPFIMLILTGPGRFSLDHLIVQKFNKTQS